MAMTREEAIEILEKEKVYMLGHGGDSQANALEMAIKALEQLPKLQNRCFALTYGQLCMFCPYDCENRTTAKREVEE